jgi:hypothetical protein
MILLGLRRSATSLSTSERRYLNVLRIRPETGYAVNFPSRVNFNTSRRGIDKNSATRSALTKGSKSSEVRDAGDTPDGLFSMNFDSEVSTLQSFGRVTALLTVRNSVQPTGMSLSLILLSL